MPERSCPSCHEPVAAHQTLCPSCRTPVPSEAGPVAADSSAFTFSAPPPRQRQPEPAAEAPGAEPAVPAEPVEAVEAPAEPAQPAGPFGAPSEATAAWTPGLDATTALPGAATWEPGPDATAVAPQAAPHAAPQAPPADDRPAWNPAASAGTIGTPGAAVLDERGNLPGGVVGLLAAALVAVGVFLPWIGVEGRDVSGWSASDDAKVLLGLAGVATVFAALLVGGARSLLLRLGLVVLGVIALGLGAFEIASASGIDEFDVSLGVGLFLVLAGGLAMAVAGAVTRHKRFR